MPGIGPYGDSTQDSVHLDGILRKYELAEAARIRACQLAEDGTLAGRLSASMEYSLWNVRADRRVLVLAQRAGVPERTIRRYLSGERGRTQVSVRSSRVVAKLARALRREGEPPVDRRWLACRAVGHWPRWWEKLTDGAPARASAIPAFAGEVQTRQRSGRAITARGGAASA